MSFHVLKLHVLLLSGNYISIRIFHFYKSACGFVFVFQTNMQVKIRELLGEKYNGIVTEKFNKIIKEQKGSLLMLWRLKFMNIMKYKRVHVQHCSHNSTLLIQWEIIFSSIIIFLCCFWNHGLQRNLELYKDVYGMQSWIREEHYRLSWIKLIAYS